MEKTVLMKFLEILVDNVLRYNYSIMQIEKKTMRKCWGYSGLQP